MTFASRTGQFATINGTALGNGKQFSPAYSATNLTLNVTAPSTHSASLRAPAPAQGTRAAPIPALPDSDGDGIPRRTGTPRPLRLRSGRPRHRPARSRQFPAHRQTQQDGHRDADRVPDANRQPFDCAQGTRTYRLEYTDDLKAPWQVLKDNIPGDGKPATIPDPAAATARPQRFYRLVVGDR